MLMPTVSITVIGLVAGLLGVLAARRRPAALLLGVAGAWAGFLAGALVGVAIDAALGDGRFVAIVGHAGAVAGAAFAVRRTARPAEGT